jgi:hypothetical protein
MSIPDFRSFACCCYHLNKFKFVSTIVVGEEKRGAFHLIEKLVNFLFELVG